MRETLDAIGPVDLVRLDSDITVRLATERIFTQLVELAVSVDNHLIAQSGSTVGANRAGRAAVREVRAFLTGVRS